MGVKVEMEFLYTVVPVFNYEYDNEKASPDAYAVSKCPNTELTTWHRIVAYCPTEEAAKNAKRLFEL
jgi:hypothetical protein